MIRKRAARIIQKAWKSKKENRASTVIQSYWRMYSAKMELARLKEQRFEFLTQNAIIIQAAYRGYCVRRHLTKCRNASIIIQTYFRRWLVQSWFNKLKGIALRIQLNHRAKVAGRAQRVKYLNYRKMIQIRAVRTIQRAWKKKRENKASTVIQSYWRMYSAIKELASLKNQRFEWLTQNAIVIQAAYRGYCVRRHLMNCRLAAIIIQKYFRKWQARSQFVKLKNIASRIQQKHRARVAGRAQRLKYLSFRIMVQLRAVKIIQNAWKKKRENRASTVIQSYWRMYSAKIELAFRKIQRFEWLTQNAIVIQAAYRGYCVRKHLFKCHQAAIIIQKHFRRCHAQSQFIKLKSITLRIQQHHRARVVGRAQRLKYINYRRMVQLRAVKIFQKAWKRKRENRASTVIQSYWRMHSAKKELALLKKQRFEWLTHNTTVIQAAYRGFSVRRHLLNCHQAAIIIQKYIRRWLVKSEFIKLKITTVRIQQNYRARVAGRAQRLKYLNYCRMVQKRAVRIIQTAWKKNKESRASSVIQSYWRMYLAQKELARLKEQRFEWLTQNAIVIQAAYRGYSARSHLLKCNKASIIIQKYFLRWHARSQFMKLKGIALRIQQHHRAKVAGRSQRLKYLSYRKMVQLRAVRIIQNAWKNKRENSASTVIQSYWRMYLAKKELSLLKKQRFEFLTQNATVIQAAYRGYCIRRHLFERHQAATIIQKYVRRWHVQSQFIKLKHVALRIQQNHRAKVSGRVQRLKYLNFRIMVQNRAVRIIQNTWKKKKENRASTIIQTYWRMYSAKKELARLRNQRLEWLTQKAILIQAAYRGFSVRRHLLKKHQAALKIQTNFRRWLARSQFVKLKTIALKIQQKHRARVVGRIQRQKYINYQIMIQKRAVRIIQEAWKRFVVNRTVKRENRASTVIQSYVRMYAAKKELACLREQKRLQWLTQNAIIIQAAYRGFSVRRHLLRFNQAAIIIQKYFSKWLAQSRFMKLKNITLKIQQKHRARVAGRAQRLKYLNYRKMVIKRAVRVIQEAWQTFVIKRRMRKENEASTVIQSYWRMHSAKKELARLKEQKRLQWLTRNAIVIQAAYRGFSTRRYILKCHQAAIIIQRYFHIWIARKRLLPSTSVQRNWFVCFRKSIICFQKGARIYLKKRQTAATVIQSYFRMWCLKKEFTKLKAAIKIQAYWRSYRVRCTITDRRVCEARKKIQAADATESNKLKNRTTRSLQLLFKDELLQNMISSLQDLDVCTQLSPKCCERLVHSGGLIILLRLVRSCNRSIPHMELIKLTTNILLNLAKYDKTVSFIWEEEDTLETTLHLMKIFREKGTFIFNKCCSLLWIFCQDPTRAQIMKENTSLTEQIRSFHYLLTRKQSIEAKRQVAKAIAAKSFNTSVLSKTMNASILQRDSARDSLQIDPDWMLGRHRRREFKDSIVAITWIMKYLDLKGK